MSHYDSYSREQLLDRIADLERNNRCVIQLQEDYSRLQSQNFHLANGLARRERKIKQLEATIERQDNKLSKYLVVEVLRKTG